MAFGEKRGIGYICIMERDSDKYMRVVNRYSRAKPFEERGHEKKRQFCGVRSTNKTSLYKVLKAHGNQSLDFDTYLTNLALHNRVLSRSDLKQKYGLFKDEIVTLACICLVAANSEKKKHTRKK